MIDPLLIESFATIAQMEAAQTRTAVLSALGVVCARFGLPHVMVASASHDGVENRYALMAANWPQPVITRYELERRASVDPLVRRAVETVLPVTVGDVRSGGTSPEEEAYLREMSTIGYVKAVSIPVVHGSRIAGAVAAYGEGDENDRDAQTLLTIVAPAAHRCVQALPPDGRVSRRRGAARPTARELECLAFSAQGQSSAEIAVTLHLSEHTVNTHLRSAIDKLGATSRVQAVAEALRRGWIQ